MLRLKKILIIQTAFIGDVILATSVAEKLHLFFPASKIDFVVRKGNESLFSNHPFINHVFVWNKGEGKIPGLLKIISHLRKEEYDLCINLQRFLTSGIMATLSGAKEIRGFAKNPISFFYHKSFDHQIRNGKHETERNLVVVEDITDSKASLPKLYPTAEDFNAVHHFKREKYFCMAPASVWFTKQLHESKWVELIQKTTEGKIFLLGAKSDKALCERIKTKCPGRPIEILCGSLSFLQSAALMKDAEMNYVNDSAPLHLASATNAPVTAFFCSTVPEFGFGPLSDNSVVIQTKLPLKCKPCGLHGYKTCPEGHFKCALEIEL